MSAPHIDFRHGLLGVATLLCALIAVAQRTQDGSTLTADQVRAEFVSGNYQVGPPTTWWADGSTTFLVRPTSGSPDQMARVLMVVVYPDLASAQSQRQRSTTNIATQSMDPSRPLLLP